MARAVIGRILALALACSPCAAAEIRHADQASGMLRFEAIQAGARFTGRFREFDVKLDFDPAQPGQGSLNVTVATASVDTRDADRDEILKSRDFFWVDEHPQAVFHAQSFAKEDAGWRATGELTIRGATRPATVHFTLTHAADETVMTGSSSLRRLDFGLGQGDWAATEWIGDEVEVSFELGLRPAAP